MNEISKEQKKKLSTNLLSSVSRSFYLSIKALPAKLREPIALAYLLARATDSIADADMLNGQRRLQDLNLLEATLLDKSSEVKALEPAFYKSLPKSEKELLVSLPELHQWLHSLDPKQQQLVSKVLSTIVSGQRLDLERFALTKQSLNSIQPLQTDSELDDYCYRVAGCVGEFWSEMGILVQSDFFKQDMDQRQAIEQAIDLGKGLQYINIIRDAPRDLKEGRCYLPQLKTEGPSWNPAVLLTDLTLFRESWNPHIDRCRQLLSSGVLYIESLKSKRCALASALPLILAVRTLQRIEAATPEQWQARVKVPRNEVKEVLTKASLTAAMGRPWSQAFPELKALTNRK